MWERSSQPRRPDRASGEVEARAQGARCPSGGATALNREVRTDVGMGLGYLEACASCTMSHGDRSLYGGQDGLWEDGDDVCV